jgi:hypothetical protein
MAIPIWAQRARFVAPLNSQPGGKPWRIAAAFSEIFTALGIDRVANSAGWGHGQSRTILSGLVSVPARTVRDGASMSLTG